ncbi:MAG: M24 family metallopeptidase [Patescibacteria group bacterium]
MGHGVGLEVHKEPHLRSAKQSYGGQAHLRSKPVSSRSVNPEVEEIPTKNMVFSIEPGLYFSWGGMRIEDLATIVGGRAKVLGRLQNNLLQIY